jgi:preprotein translocase subunit SecA
MSWSDVWSRVTGRPHLLRGREHAEELHAILARRRQLREVSDEELTRAARGVDVARGETFAVACEAARRTLGLDPFDVQVLGGLVMADGQIAEMQTGEGKTLAATLPVCWAALSGTPVHVLTANDYLARRDARWMAPVYRMLGLTVGSVGQAAELAARRQAYACDVTYGSATEVGFDFLRDQLRRRPGDLVQRPFGLALVDEIDSILIDEARIPLVIAGGDSAPVEVARVANAVAPQLLRGRDFEAEGADRRIVLTEAGAQRAERLFGCGNLYEPANGALLAALVQALHAYSLLRRDVDYIVRDGQVALVDEHKGRLARLRRWPEGLQAAVEAKEGVSIQHAGRVLGSITLQSFISLYPRVCGMTGTAATQAAEFKEVYGLDVVVVPPHRPVIRRDLPDVVWTTRAEKHGALLSRVRDAHERGRPVLVGTASVAESEALAARLAAAGVPSRVLNARNEEEEAGIVRQAGRLGAVTISTNMAGRGTDILLGGDPPQERERVVVRGGLLVLGTNRHESRRIDHQLRGRAGRQGDPGESEFHVSLEDDLFRRFGLDRDTDTDHAQRVIEGQHLEIRQNLLRYERILELQRRIVHQQRREVLLGEAESLLARELPERHHELVAALGGDALARLERDVTLATIDEEWSQYLEEAGHTREDSAWVALSGVPLHEYQRNVAAMFERFWERVDGLVLEAFREGTAESIAERAAGTGATWTYQTSDQAFPDVMTRMLERVRNLVHRRPAQR